MRRFILSIAFLGLATAASAQQTGPGWSAFTGCWTPVATDGSRNIAANTPRVCVIPRDANAADLITLVNDSITDRTRVDASGRQQEVSKQGCAGWERAEFSADGRRLYLRGEQTCAGGLKRITTGIFAIATNGDFINAVNVSADSSNSVRVSRYGSTTTHATMPAEIRETLAGRELSDRTARVSAQREVGTDAVIEATRFVAAPAVEAWLAELEQDFDLDDKALIRLADQNVPPSVIDMMIAVSHPRSFSVRPTGAIERDEESNPDARERHRPCFAPVMDPWAWSAYDPCDPFLRYGYYSSRHYRYGSRYYDPYYGYGGYYGAPVIIVNGGGGVPREKGRMTKDGYKRSPSTTATESSAPRSTQSRDSGSSSSGSASSRSSSSGSSSSGSSSSGSGRTATRKPPA